VPAAAVIQRLQALSGFIGRKAFRRLFSMFKFKDRSLTACSVWKLLDLKYKKVAGTLQVGVKSVDMQRNAKSESRLLSVS
jgi:hypothetical protein